MEPYPASRFQYRAAAISVDALPAGDLPVVQSLYRVLQGLYEQVKPSDSRHRPTAAEVCALARALKFDEVIQSLNQLTLSGASGPIAKAYHDIRSGSLAAITMLLDLMQLEMVNAESVEKLYTLSRDHLKIMRNCIYDLDAEGFERDLLPVDHSVRLLSEKWSGARYCIPEACAEIEFDASFDGVVSSCCMEFAALDRALYNLINNATRFSADEQVTVRVDADKPRGQTNVRFSISNAVSPDNIRKLEDTLNANNSSLSDLFKGGLTMGGNGFGMSICADLVCHNYEIDSVESALQQQMVGVELAGQRVHVWFNCPGQWYE